MADVRELIRAEPQIVQTLIRVKMSHNAVGLTGGGVHEEDFESLGCAALGWWKDIVESVQFLDKSCGFDLTPPTEIAEQLLQKLALRAPWKIWK